MENRTEYIDLLAESGEQFLLRTAGKQLLKYRPAAINGGALMLCTAGNAVLKIDTEAYSIMEGSEAVLFDCIILLEECSEDFTLSLFIFSKKFKEQATRKFDPEFFGHLASYPVYRHPEGCYENTRCYFRLIEDMQADVRNRYRNVIAMNLLRSMLFNIHDKIQKQIADEMRFPDQSYFGRYFKHFTKTSPSEYRRRVIEM